MNAAIRFRNASKADRIWHKPAALGCLFVQKSMRFIRIFHEKGTFLMIIGRDEAGCDAFVELAASQRRCGGIRPVMRVLPQGPRRVTFTMGQKEGSLICYE